MTNKLTDNTVDAREYNRVLAERQAYIIDKLITRFDERITFWLTDCGHDEYTVRVHRWQKIGYMERHLYASELVVFARQVAWTHI
ncbi:hypothetical protein [Salmonella enterica]|uniref:hypothetical protein n=1 Tax=Salmonella enterica TaxID=28901 RepID=UPI0003BD4F89|nr:hypothetical protein [Salmonella enterica]APV90409.1 hypothetical protein SEEM1958_021995 [Salmonella enterica subsp. enterica serovar Mbandaka str. ATCC 51958]EBF8299842.1 hypothetical protein [Salmonella enterica subsp. enterica serovar Mbandaka]